MDDQWWNHTRKQADKISVILKNRLKPPNYLCLLKLEAFQ